jgi:hypothetical protein
MYSLPGLQRDNVSSSGFVYDERSRFIRRNEFHRICGKSGSDGQEKNEKERDLHWMQGVSALDQEKSANGKMQNSLISRTCIMKPKDFLRSVILIVALAAFGISAGLAIDKNEAKHSKITKARAERIALTKVPGGSIRSAELETAQGLRFWSVYIAKPGSKNAKEIRVDATSGRILAVQTERPEDQAEEPPKIH